MRSTARLLFTLALLSLGCGSSAALAPGLDPPKGPFDAGGEHPPVDDGGGTVPAPLCTVGADQTCNDNPIVSSLWGTCGPGGVCVCKDGLSINPATGRCRPGSVCEAAATDHWAVSVRLDPSDCAMRTDAPCTGAIPTTTDYATSAVGSLATARCKFPPGMHLRVELVAGCATIFELDREPTDPTLIACLEKGLRSVRWTCTGEKACALFEHDTLP